MPKLKEVQMICFSPSSKFADCEIGWDDVWLKFKNHRRPVCIGPTFISRKYIENELKFRETDKTLKHVKYNTEYCNELRNILQKLKTNNIVMISKKENNITIYSSRDSLNRKEIEKMSRFYMKSVGFKHVKFRWKKSKYLVIPFSF